MKKILITVLILAVMLPGICHAIDFNLGSIVKVAGIGLIIPMIAGPINSFINTVTLNNKLDADVATKVVPIISIGTGGYIGAAQVAGPKDKVDTAKAVAQIEVDWQDKARVKVLIPVDNVNPLQGIKRVKGVGVSAVIDIKI
jgi:hypothetical protein